MEQRQGTQTNTTDSHESNHVKDAEVQELLAKKNATDNNVENIEFDKMQLYRGDPYPVEKGITIYEPTVGEIVSYGEKEFMAMLNVFISHTTQYRLQLWKIGMDWNRISDFHLFCLLTRNLTKEQTAILFKDLDFQEFKFCQIALTEEQKALNREHKNDKDWKVLRNQYFLINQDKEIVINEHYYNVIATYIRTMFNIFPKVEKTKSKDAKNSIIWEEENNLAYAKHQNKQWKSFLFPLISSCVCHSGFKYNSKEVMDIGIFELMTSVQRLQIYESSHALNIGRFSGFCDTSKIDSNLFNFMRDVDTNEK